MFDAEVVLAVPVDNKDHTMAATHSGILVKCIHIRVQKSCHDSVVVQFW